MNLFVDLAQKVSRGKRKPDQSRVTQVKRAKVRGDKKCALCIACLFCKINGTTPIGHCAIFFNNKEPNLLLKTEDVGYRPDLHFWRIGSYIEMRL